MVELLGQVVGGPVDAKVTIHPFPPRGSRPYPLTCAAPSDGVAVVMAKPSKTPAQQQRNKYMASVRARGASGHNLWFVSPPLDPAELSLTLCSDLEFETFLYLEGSPDLPSVDYAPLRLQEAAAGPNPRHFATATTLDGTRLDIELRPEATQPSIAGRRMINLAVLTAAKTRIESWRAIVPAINRCRSHTLNPVIFRCRQLLQDSGERTVLDISRELASENTALVVGALATMLRTRELQSDVDHQLWGPQTRVWERGHG